jgi:hypothetical protein
MVTYSPMPSGISLIWAMKTEAMLTNRAVPSILTVAPMGKTNRDTLESTFTFWSMHLKVTGRAAALCMHHISGGVQWPGVRDFFGNKASLNLYNISHAAFSISQIVPI